MRITNTGVLTASVFCCLLLDVTAMAQEGPRRTIEEISDGVYRVMNNFHGTVFMVTEEGIILVDPLRPDFAEWLKVELDERFGVPVRYVIYSHHHGDHASGGAVFADTAEFVGHANMLEHLAMPDSSTELSDIVGQQSPYAALDADGDGVISRAEGASIGPLMVFADFDEDENGEISGAELMRGPIGRVHPPNITFSDRIELELGGKRVRMDWLGEFNHSFDSSLITFPDASVLFIVDAVTFGRMPHTEMDYELGLYREWMEVIRRVEEISKDYDYVATGHGPMGTSEDVTRWREYFEALEAAVAGGIEADRSLEQMMETIELPEYSDWVSYDAWLPLNVRGMYHFLTD
jgi:glyoxylase-like metal-dependent hydrolase (beta-lactamase superfamily II)